jgi:hypothetical protein
MSDKTTKSNKSNGKVEPAYDQKAFLKVWDEFWSEGVKNPDQYLLKYLRVEMPDHYEPIRKLINSKQKAWDIDKAIRAYFKSQGILPKTVRKVKKATNGKSKAK